MGREHHQASDTTETPEHDHGHGHGARSHAPSTFGRAFAIGITLNVSFVVLEIIYGFLSHSLALVADAGHNFGDVIGLFLAWLASSLAKKRPTPRHTYGYKRSTILAAFLNALLLLLSMGALAWEAISRFNRPTHVAAQTVIWVSSIGIAVNAVTALMFLSGRKHDMNIRAAFLHMAGDALISAGVVGAGIMMTLTHWLWLDPTMSLLIVVLIVWSTWGLFRDSLNLSLDAVPEGIDPGKVRAYLGGLPGVVDAHDLHIWALSTTETALTVHLVTKPGAIDCDGLHAIRHELEDEFDIHHVTIQLEPTNSAHCATTRCD